MKTFDLETYLAQSVENIIKNALKATLKDPKESAFLLKYAKSASAAAKKRAASAEKGEHIPPFLIASITESCNLHCAGCYARHNHACCDGPLKDQLTATEWLRLFKEAKDLGIGFILLAGGEPLIRKDIIEAAATVPEILFPVFTNGTMIHAEYMDLFDAHRNLLPVFSIEGDQKTTDSRRGEGVYRKLITAMDQMKERHLSFGASVTVTRSNLKEVTSAPFLEEMKQRGCKVIIYVEYVPVSADSADLAPQDKDRAELEQRLTALRQTEEDIMFISFPGDEKSSGGCLAAGRGFFHINARGGAEPCPFSPYSDINVKTTSLKEALKSELFLALQREHLLLTDHKGGCVLFEQKEKVEALLKKESR